MAEIVSFPEPSESAWLAVEGFVRDNVRKAGRGDAMAAWILADLKPRFDACQNQYGIDVPAEAAPAVAELIKSMRGAMNAALLQMLLLEIELYEAKFGGDNGADRA